MREKCPLKRCQAMAGMPDVAQFGGAAGIALISVQSALRSARPQS